jgi:hypothetical protein
MINTNFCAQLYIKVDETASQLSKSNWNRIKARYEEGRAVTSAERGSLVTMSVAVNANGNFVPPFFVFSRKTTGIASLQGDQMAVLDLQTSGGG